MKRNQTPAKATANEGHTARSTWAPHGGVARIQATAHVWLRRSPGLVACIPTRQYSIYSRWFEVRTCSQPHCAYQIISKGSGSRNGAISLVDGLISRGLLFRSSPHLCRMGCKLRPWTDFARRCLAASCNHLPSRADLAERNASVRDHRETVPSVGPIWRWRALLIAPLLPSHMPTLLLGRLGRCVARLPT
ncbi:hypothetical protein IQ07DRAFT_213962 [Pyrenochaeta sp. DS3sAY3a]|nr:hypothetical protein IQ07DRAFT_213962 [Pyrenochaeta sp. DS3sAY3a]